MKDDDSLVAARTGSVAERLASTDSCIPLIAVGMLAYTKIPEGG